MTYMHVEGMLATDIMTDMSRLPVIIINSDSSAQITDQDLTPATIQTNSNNVVHFSHNEIP